MNIESMEFNQEYKEGAHNAIHVCLRVKPSERVTVITDHECAEITAALVQEIKEIGAPFTIFVLEDFGSRPLAKMPGEILDDLASSQVSIYATIAKPGELKIRRQMVEIVNAKRIRHAHMVNITPLIMLQGMRADFLSIDRLSRALLDLAQKTRHIKATSPAGTEIFAEFTPDIKWIKTSGIISSDKWGNLPGGEIFTSPHKISGVFVVDGVVGNYLCQKYGDLRDHPLSIQIEDSRVKALSCDNESLVVEFRKYIETDSNSNRVGEFAIGTNLAVKDIIGNILQDEKMPGIHIAFGHPYSEHTGANWMSSTHIDCVGRDFDIWMDDEQIMKHGKFTFKPFDKR